MVKEHEIIGRQQVGLENLSVAYDTLLNVLSQVVTGQVDCSRVTVDIPNRSWAIAEPEEAKVEDEEV